MSESAPSRHFFFSVAAVLVAIVLLCGCSSDRRAARSGRTVGVGGEVLVGGINWRVLQVKRTAHLARRFAGSMRAEGIFMVLQISAERESEPGPVSASALSIVDSRGREYREGSLAKEAIDEAGLDRLGGEHIAEQVPVEGWVAFDVARDARGLRLKVEDASKRSSDVAFIKLP